MWSPWVQRPLPFRGLDRPFLPWGIALILLGAILIFLGIVVAWPWAIVFGICLPIVGILLLLIYRASDGSYHI